MSNAPPPRPPSLWQQIRSPAPSRPQRVFDFIFGVAAPILCLIFDPGFFRSQPDTNFGCTFIIFNAVTVLVYPAVGVGSLALTGWLIASHRFQRMRPALAGLFLAGWLFAAALGIALLPFTVLGTFYYGLGLLGLIPFFTASAFWRNFKLAWRTEPTAPSRWRLGLAALGFVFALGLPLGTQLAAVRFLPGFPPSLPASCTTQASE